MSATETEIHTGAAASSATAERMPPRAPRSGWIEHWDTGEPRVLGVDRHVRSPAAT